MSEHYFHIDYKFSHHMELENSEFPNVDELRGEIFYNNYEYRSDPVKIGHIELHLYNHAFSDYGFTLYQAFDRSMNTFGLGNAILDYKLGGLKEELENEIGVSINPNILVVHEMILYSQYRSKGYGKEILDGIETFFNGKCGYIALQSFPKQHDVSIKETKEFKKFELDLMNNNFEDSQIKLDLFYENCGFHKFCFHEESFLLKILMPCNDHV